jgi:DNA-directed RNA polymerase specialized sigma24 family protein
VGEVGLTTSDLDAARCLNPLGVARVYDELAPTVYRFFIAAVGDTTAAEELTGSVFQAVLEQLPNAPDDPSQLHGWLFRVALRHLHTDRALRGPRAGAPTPTVALLDRLPDDQREILALRLGAGRTVPQIAELLAVPAGVVRALQRQALATLAPLLDDPDPV